METPNRIKLGIDSEDALRELRRLADYSVFEKESLVGALARIKYWVRYADEAMLKNDTYSAQMCLEVVKRLLGI